MMQLIDFLAPDERLQAEIYDRRSRAFVPPPDITASEWADNVRIVPSETSGVTGDWETSTYEVARGPMDAISEPGVRQITGMASAQIFKTTTIETAVGYFMHLNPRPILVYEPTEATVNSFIDSKLDPMIKSTPELAELWGGLAAIERKNDKFVHAKKTFAGGYVEILTANSPSNTASRSAGVACADEIDKFEMTKDGDAVALIGERLKGFSGEELLILMSTPTIEGKSPIAAEYEKSDRRKPYVTCPHCDEMHYFKWENVNFKDADGKSSADCAVYVCEACGGVWSESDRIKVLTTKGAVSWRQTRPFECCGESQDPEVDRTWDEAGRALCKVCGERAVPNRHAGFWAWELYHPRRSVADLIRVWLDCQGDRGKLQNFVNSKIARTFAAGVEKELAFDPDQLESRAEPDWIHVPERAICITAGADIQTGENDPRIEVEFVAWGPGEESWSLGYEVIRGSIYDDQTWQAFANELKRTFTRADGKEMRVSATCVDSGASPDVVLAFTNPRSKNVWAIKSVDQGAGSRREIWPSSKSVSKARGAVGSTFYGIFSQSAKDVIGEHMKVAVPGPGYMHTPASRDRRWYNQMTSEQKLRVVNGGQISYYWKVKSAGIRNEALDCRVYALAALRGLYAKGALSPLNRIGAAVPGKSSPAPAASSADSTSPDAHVTTVTAPKSRPRRVAKSRRKGGGNLFGM